MNQELFWQTKLAARLHDPAEKALVLLRDPLGHENGTSRALQRLLGLDQPSGDIAPDNTQVLSTVIFKNGLPLNIYRHVQRADWWAAAADRPQWPMEEVTITTKKGEEKTLQVTNWARVNWSKDPVLIHPLTGEQLNLNKHGGLSDTDFSDIKQRSFNHFSTLLTKLGAKENEALDFRKTLLAYWRFGPYLSVTGADTEDFGKLGALWEMLPADTRVPDHSIWDHLDLASAFAGAFAADPNDEAALLALAIGPVQGFIAAARKMDDLWAGSHLLSRLAWEAMRPVCEELGPDAILFPRLRGIPQVDLWLRDEMGLPQELFEHCKWMQGSTDANPLFSAALPNRFVAVVPASQAREIAEKATTAVREWLQKLGERVVDLLLKTAGFDKSEMTTPYKQMKEQLEGFPEVHWAAVPFSLIRPRNAERQTDLDTTALSAAMVPFYGAKEGEDCGFLASPAWQLLKDGLKFTNASGKTISFFAPNPGVLYPAVYELAERVLAAAKATRTFNQSQQQGWRCSLTGEAEWLTTDRAQLSLPPGSRSDTLWTRIAKNKKAWAKEGEHLSALPAIKRLWPTIFAEEVARATNSKISRFVVSTHTMALAHQLDKWLEKGGTPISGLDCNAAEPVALPRRLVRCHNENPALDVARSLPALLDTEDEAAYENTRRQIEQGFAAAFGQDKVRLETYYAMLLMDGDRMGVILTGDDNTTISYRESFHPQVRTGFDQYAANQPIIKQYGEQKRAVSPNRHLAISGALNDFSQTVVRHVVEEEHLGRVIYAGGDDVLAMLPVVDLLPVMQRLRNAYSGHDPEHEGGVYQGLTLQKGFATLKTHGHLHVMRMMGTSATASCGAVIAHHQAPLGAVLRELRAAEKRAKEEGGRDAFSITVIKRSGGALRLTAKWGEPLALLNDLRRFLADPGVSRRAIYNTLEWLKEKDLPVQDQAVDGAMLQALLAYQLNRQTDSEAQEAKAMIPRLVEGLTQLTLAQNAQNRIAWLRNFLAVAEFLARETRTGGDA